MFAQGSSRLRVALTAAAVVLGGSVARNACAQPPIPTGGAQSIREPGPVVPEMIEAGGPQQRTSTGQPVMTPVFTPGYFEVVCPAMFYGGAFHVFGNRAYGGAGYYGPLRRYWAYSTYGPNFNIGPDNSLQYGLIGGCMYVAERKCQGLYKHGYDCACHCSHCTKGGSAAAAYADIAQIGSSGGTIGRIGSSGGGPSPVAPEPVGAAPRSPGQPQPPAENVPPPTPNSAHLQLVVPENAEVLVEGSRTATTGTIREFVTPPLTPGKNMLYDITIRYKDAAGNPIEETRTVRVRANDQLRIDCTPQAAAQARASSQP